LTFINNSLSTIATRYLGFRKFVIRQKTGLNWDLTRR